MTTNEKLYNITITEAEAELITTALHGEYKHIKNLLKGATDNDRARLTTKTDDLRKTRNGFAALINRFYSGEDA